MDAIICSTTTHKGRLEFPSQEKSIFRSLQLRFLLDVEICSLLLPQGLTCVQSFRVLFFYLSGGQTWNQQNKQAALGEEVQEEITVLCLGEGLPNRVTLGQRSDEIGYSSASILWLGCNLAQEGMCSPWAVIPSLVHWQQFHRRCSWLIFANGI